MAALSARCSGSCTRCLGFKFHSKIDSSARPLASSLAVIYVQLMLQGSMGCGSACNDVQKQLKAAGLRTPMAIMHAVHSSIFIFGTKSCVLGRQDGSRHYLECVKQHVRDKAPWHELGTSGTWTCCHILRGCSRRIESCELLEYSIRIQI